VLFSGEQLIAAANIDFVNRPRVVSALAPGRLVRLGAEAGRLQTKGAGATDGACPSAWCLV
jgi:hypothetical protein